MVEVSEMVRSEIGVRRLELAAALATVTVRPGYEIPTDQFRSLNDEYIGNFRVLLEDLRWMLTEGWIDYEAPAGGLPGVHLLSAGQQAGMNFIEARSDLVARAQQARESVLRWLYECDLSEVLSPRYQDFMDSKHGAYLGKQFTSREITKAIAWLESNELVTGEYMTGAAYYTNPKITPNGDKVIERYGSLSKVPDNVGTNTTNYHLHGSHGNNFATNSQHVSQSTAVTVEQVAEAAKFVESARDLIPLLRLSNEQEVELAEVVDEVEAEAQTVTPKKNVLVELITKSRDLAVLSTASGMVTAFEGIAKTALAAIGG